MSSEVERDVGLWRGVKDIFRPESWRARQRVKEHLQSTSPEKWDRFVADATSPDFIRQLKRNQSVDNKTVIHAISMGMLQGSPPVDQVESTTEPGKTYQIRSLPGGQLGCTCNDWRYKGSVKPGYECKHIKAHKAAAEKTASFRAMTAAFFDELAKVRDQKKKDVHDGLRQGYADSAAPYSNLLTQGEETTYYPRRPAPPIDDFEVIIGT